MHNGNVWNITKVGIQQPILFGANIGNENDQQTWMKKNNEQIHNQNDNKGKDKVISMKCLDCRH